MSATRLAVLALIAAACGGGAPTPVCPPAAVASPPPSALAAVLGAAAAPPTVDEATAFLADVERHLREVWTRGARADWINQNFITDDTEALSADSAADTAKYLGEAIVRSRRFDAIKDQLPADVVRKLYLLSIAQTVPAPADAGARTELTTIEASMTAMYGKGEYCPPAGSPLLKYSSKTESNGKAACLHIGELSKVLSKSRRFDELVEAWRGWHAIAQPMKAKYARYVQLANQGTKEIGFADVGALWKSSWDLPPADFEADVERLWNDVKPLYDDLHCYVRGALQKTYGKDKVPDHAPIPAQLLGNLWAQEWNNIYDLVTPYPKEPSLDIDKKLAAGHWNSVKMVKQGERFFTALGFDPLPPSFWERSLLSRPSDRDVVCHASAWDLSYGGDLRIKACFEPTEQDLLTVHHELGHDFYFQRYGALPILFQSGANGGFHEAIGDTVALSVTPEYLKTIGLLDAGSGSTEVPPQAGRRPEGRTRPEGQAPRDRTRMNEQMKQALEKVAFLPFGLILDKWRWDVFAGKVTPERYNDAWWALKQKYQGVSAPVARTADDFDPGAKYHVAASSTYVIYFLARIYQFQFHKALCQAAGYTGPLDQCSIHDNKAAGAKLVAMLAMGASKPWPDAMEAVGAGRKADAGPMLEYFAPLRAWLADQNKGKTCGW